MEQIKTTDESAGLYEMDKLRRKKIRRNRKIGICKRGASKKKERRMEKAKRKQQELTLRRLGREKKENKNM